MQRNKAAKPDAEFSLIERYFARAPVARDDVILGIGDDAALLAVSSNDYLTTSVVSIDQNIVENADGATLGHLALALPLTELASRDATPRWFTLGLSLPCLDTQWLDVFSKALLVLADTYACALVGGDTTQGERRITVFAHGAMETPHGGARVKCGDIIYLSTLIGNVRAPPPVAFAKSLQARGLGAIAPLGNGLVPALMTLDDSGTLGMNIDLRAVPVTGIRPTSDRTMVARLERDEASIGLCFTLPASFDATSLRDDFAVPIGHVSGRPGIHYCNAGRVLWTHSK